MSENRPKAFWLRLAADCLQVASSDPLAKTPSPSIAPPPFWLIELASSLQFRPHLAYRFRKSNHMNVNEQRSLNTLIKNLAATTPCKRFAILQDSDVSNFATAKGRSSSPSLNHILLTSLPYILGSNLYLDLFRIPSRWNAADDPTRDVPIRARIRGLPRWYKELAKGRTAYFDTCVWTDSLPQPLNFWARLILLTELVR